MSGEFGKSKEEGQSSTQVQIPDFLKPFIGQMQAVGSNTLGRLARQLTGPAKDFVAGFDPLQREAQGDAVAFARGAGGFLPTAQNELMDTASGRGVNFLPRSALNGLNAISRGQPLLNAPLEGALDRIGTGNAGPLAGTEALERTAAGDFLFGGEGFDKAVQAAVRAAQPGIASVFGGGGPGAATGGLAQSAIGKAAVDAFAGQFGQERANQIQAANLLGMRDLTGRDQQLAAIGQRANIGGMGQDLRMRAGGMLGGFADAERMRQEMAARDLPGIGMAGINVMDAVGGARQGLRQQMLTAPTNAQLQLLQAALGRMPIDSLLGQNTQGSGTRSGFSFGWEQA